jgi:hypothetical protein
LALPDLRAGFAAFLAFAAFLRAFAIVTPFL